MARPATAHRTAGIALAAALTLGACSTTAVEPLLAPGKNLWPAWTPHDPASALAVDHSPWDRLLGTYVVAGKDGVNRFAYARVDTAGRRALDGYIDALTAVPVERLNRDEQLAYWINLYNALTVKVVLLHYPVETILDIDISPGLLADGPWDKKLIRVGRHPIGLNDIEHRILRPIWNDARLHYVLNCASIGCPNLRIEAYTGANVLRLLDRAARDYVNDPRGVCPENGGIVLSKIYLWYADDFGATRAERLAHLRRFARPDLAARLGPGATVRGYEYDWSLNDAR